MKAINAKNLPSVHFTSRPASIKIDTIIIHSMHNPDPNCSDPFSPQLCKELLDAYGFSVHYSIDLQGNIWKHVDEENLAFHAGPSKMPNDGREKVNEFSVGIELIGDDKSDFTDAQYSALAVLVKQIKKRHNIKHILGHSDIAPDRKTDPWGFDWERFRKEIDSLD